MPGPRYPSAPADSAVKGRMDRDPLHALTSGEYRMPMKQETPFWGPVRVSQAQTQWAGSSSHLLAGAACNSPAELTTG